MAHEGPSATTRQRERVCWPRCVFVCVRACGSVRLRLRGISPLLSPAPFYRRFTRFLSARVCQSNTAAAQRRPRRKDEMIDSALAPAPSNKSSLELFSAIIPAGPSALRRRRSGIEPVFTLQFMLWSRFWPVAQRWRNSS